jgi:PAS domain S-box-containing protein
VVLNTASRAALLFVTIAVVSVIIQPIPTGSLWNNDLALLTVVTCLGWAAFATRRSPSIRASVALGATLGFGLVAILFVGLNANVSALLIGASMLALLTLGRGAAQFAIAVASLGFVATALALGVFGWTAPNTPLTPAVAVRSLMTFLAFGGGSVAAVHYIIERLERTTSALRERTAALRRSEADFRALFDHVFDGVFRTSADGVLLAANRALAEILGYGTPEELLNLDDVGAIYLRREDRDELRRRLARDGELRNAEVVLKRKDGREVYVLMNARVARDAAGTACCEGTVTDLTERRRLEEQLVQAVKMEAVGRLAGGVAHDFNNLLTIILGYTDILRASAPQDADRQHLESIRAAASSASDLTRQLLAFSRKQILMPQIVDLNAIVERMLSLLTRLLGEDIVVEMQLADPLHMVEADPGQLEQVIVNLCVNARDAMAAGGRLTIVTANVELSADEASLIDGLAAGPHVAMRVVDTGVGIDPAVQARIFEPFFTTKEPAKGTGLGLATVYGILRQSGGSVSVQSQPGAGTAFTILLPRAEPRAALQPAAQASPRGGSETILVVEDEPEVRDIIRLFLGAEGYVVLQAASGLDALRVCVLNPRLDLVITDVIMPDMGGPELVTRLATSMPTVRVLMMSGYTDDAMLKRGTHEPGRGILQKPFTREGLLEAVRGVLDDVAVVFRPAVPPGVR